MSRQLILASFILSASVALGKTPELVRSEATLSLAIATTQRAKSDVSKIQALKESSELVATDLESIIKKIEQLAIDDRNRDSIIEEKQRIAEINILLGSLSDLEIENGKLSAQSCREAYLIVFGNNRAGDEPIPASRNQKAIYRAVTANCSK